MERREGLGSPDDWEWSDEDEDLGDVEAAIAQKERQLGRRLRPEEEADIRRAYEELDDEVPSATPPLRQERRGFGALRETEQKLAEERKDGNTI